MTIDFIAFTCDICGVEALGGKGSDMSTEFAILNNGKIACHTCGHERADQVFKWLLLEGDSEEPTEEPEG